MAERGRPSDYGPEIASGICQLVAEGKSLRSIEAIAGMPNRVTILRWLDRHEEFRSQYARAREASADHLAEEIVEIADDPRLDPNDKRVRVDARKWVAAKLKPKKYGDKLTQEHTGADGAPLSFVMNLHCGPNKLG